MCSPLVKISNRDLCKYNSWRIGIVINTIENGLEMIVQIAQIVVSFKMWFCVCEYDT